jgi:hypothetical protein
MARSLPVNVSFAIGRGSTDDESYAHSRLRKDRPDIHARVLAGEITAHAEMTATASAWSAIRIECVDEVIRL